MIAPPSIRARRLRDTVAATLLAAVALTGSAASATPISATATYTNADPSFTDTVTITGEFDSTGISGVGTEFVQVTSLVFDFSKLAFLQSPTAIGPQTPPYAQGTFLAQYTDGVFDAIVSAGGAGGFAQPASRVDPSRSAVKEYIVMGLDNDVGSLSEFFEFSGLGGSYESDLSMDPYVLTLIPEPGTGMLLALGLSALAARRRTG